MTALKNFINTKSVMLLITLLFLSTTISGCASTDKRPPIPPTVTIDKALGQIGTGFHSFREALDGQENENGDNRESQNSPRIRTGLIPSEIVITFQLAETASSELGLALNLSNPVIVKTNNNGGTLSANANSSNSQQVGNSITIKLVSSLDYLSDRTTQSCSTITEKGESKKTCTTITTKATDITAVQAYQNWLNIGPKTPGNDAGPFFFKNYRFETDKKGNFHLIPITKVMQKPQPKSSQALDKKKATPRKEGWILDKDMLLLEMPENK